MRNVSKVVDLKKSATFYSIKNKKHDIIETKYILKAVYIM